MVSPGCSNIFTDQHRKVQPHNTERMEMDAAWKPVLKKRGMSVAWAAPAA
jgi:hypothetical protein